MNWKQFKTWLDKNIIESEGLAVKIRVEKQDKYSELSTVVLTNFCDSLEATLDNNTSCHLFPELTGDKNFREIFDHQNCYFGKKTLEQRLNESDYCLLEKLFDEWKTMQINNTNRNKSNTNMNTRNILLIGRTGSGKSSLANVLMGENKFVESAKSISATKHVEEGIFEIDLDNEGNEKIRYRVIDTIGIGDTKMKPQGVLIRLAEMADWVKQEGLNQILFVTKGRFAKEEIEAYDLLSSIIFDKDVVKYTTVVRTGFPEFEDKEVCDDDRYSLRTENADLAHILEKVNIIYVDNPPLKGRNKEANEEIREESRKRLLTYLGKCRKTYRPENIDTLEERVQDYKTHEEKLKEKMKELEQARKEQEAEFRKKLADLKEEQAQELRENRRQFEEQLHKTKLEGEENLRKTRREMEDEQKRKLDEQEQKNKERERQTEERHNEKIKKVEEETEKTKKEFKEESRRNREESDRLRKELSEKKDNTEMFMKMMEQNRKDDQARQDRLEQQRLESERKERQERREFENRRLEAEEKRQEIERKKAKMQAAWRKWEEDKKSFLEEQDSYFWGRESDWREKMPKPPSGDYNDY